jgi:hypothetical protein
MTGAEQIMQAIIAALTAPAMDSVPAADIHRDIVRAIEMDAPLAIAVEEGDEPAPDYPFIGFLDRTLEFRLAVIAKGKNTATLTDPAIREAHARIMADTTLGGIVFDITEGETTRQRDTLEKPVLATTKTYRVRYRTRESGLEISP